MRFVVTGATSMIGSSFVEAAVNQGHEVLAIVRKNSKNLNRLPESSLISIEYADMAHICCVQGDGGKYDALYHFAWDYIDREGRYDVDGQLKNVNYTLDVVSLAQKLNVERFIGVGSQAEYGRVSGIIDDQTVLKPQIPYAMAKVSAYWMSKEKCKQYGIKHFWGRVFSVYGNHDHEGTLLLYAVDSFLRGEKAYFSSGQQHWNYLHERDAGRMFLLLGTLDIEPDVYFIANPESQILRTYLEEIIELFKNPIYEFESNAKEYLYGIHPSMEKEKRVLKFQPSVSFDEGIKELIESRKLKYY